MRSCAPCRQGLLAWRAMTTDNRAEEARRRAPSLSFSQRGPDSERIRAFLFLCFQRPSCRGAARAAYRSLTTCRGAAPVLAGRKPRNKQRSGGRRSDARVRPTSVVPNQYRRHRPGRVRRKCARVRAPLCSEQTRRALGPSLADGHNRSGSSSIVQLIWKGTIMRKHFMRSMPARPRRTMVQAIARRLTRAAQTLHRYRMPDLRDLDQRVRESGEW